MPARFDPDLTGHGWLIDRLLIDGKPVAAPYIPYAALKQNFRIHLHRIATRHSSS